VPCLPQSNCGAVVSPLTARDIPSPQVVTVQGQSSIERLSRSAPGIAGRYPIGGSAIRSDSWSVTRAGRQNH